MRRDGHPDHAAISAATTELQLTIRTALATALAEPRLPEAVRIVQEAIAQHWDTMLPEAVRDALVSLAVGAYLNGFVKIPDEVRDSGAGVMLELAQGPEDLAVEFASSCAFHDPDAEVMRTLAVLAVLSDQRRRGA